MSCLGFTLVYLFLKNLRTLLDLSLSIIVAFSALFSPLPRKFQLILVLQHFKYHSILALYRPKTVYLYLPAEFNELQVPSLGLILENRVFCHLSKLFFVFSSEFSLILNQHPYSQFLVTRNFQEKPSHRANPRHN